MRKNTSFNHAMLLGLLCLSFLSLSAPPLRAEESCPPHSHPERQDETEDAVTLHCKCNDGYKFSNGACKEWFGHFEVISLRGAVEFYKGDQKIKDAGKIGQHVTAGKIVTGPDGQVEIQLRDGHKIIVSSNSEFVFSNPEELEKNQGAARIIKGAIRAWSDVLKGKPHLRIQTSVCALAVRGTDFTVDASLAAGGTKVQVFEGEVEVNPLKGGPGTLLKKGEAVEVRKDGTIAPPLRMNIAEAQTEWGKRLPTLG